MSEKKLFIGLDVGSDSVGWAATDEEFKLRRIKGKNAWGARIFDAGVSAEGRRMKRVNRRRMARRKYRIYLLNTLFNNALQEVDPTFLLRLEQSSLWHEDKAQLPLTTVFPSVEEEKAYYKKYPTIWHLRKALADGDESALKDIRLVYLAIHHIIKYRGNFLKVGDFKLNQLEDSIFDATNDCFASICNRAIEEEGDEVESPRLPASSKLELCKIMEDTNLNARDKKKKVLSLIEGGMDDPAKLYVDLFVSLLTGNSFELSKIYEDKEKLAIKFDNKYDENEIRFAEYLGEDFELVQCAKQIHDYFELKDLLRGQQRLCDAFVSVYEAHKQELACLKRISKEIDARHSLVGEDSIYFKLFKDPNNKFNYPAFVHVDSPFDKCDVDSFIKEINKILSPYMDEISNDIEFKHLKIMLDRKEALRTIASYSTSTIPHQLHEVELKQILDHASKYHACIKDNAEKIKQLFLFRVPYYYGPLDTRSDYSNVIRKNNETITPWNISEEVDDEATRAKFMDSLTNNCSYLIGESSVLPLDSLIYQSYNILNRLNGISINGAKISQKVKEELYVYIRARRKTTIHQIKVFLEKRYDEYARDKASISGINDKDDFISDSYELMLRLFDADALSDAQERLAEEMIRVMTLYTDYPEDALNYIDKNIVPLDKKGRAILKSKKFKGWGRLSKRLLVDMKVCDDLGVYHSIIDTLEETTKTFNEIIFDSSLGFGEEIERINKEFTEARTTEDVVNEIIDNLPPDRRRPTIQAIRIVDEVVKLAKQEPDYISLEVTRQEEKDKRRKPSRYEELTDFLKSLTKIPSLKEPATHSLDTLKSMFDDDIKRLKLKGEALYLYFKQASIDLYTGKVIDINDVLNSDKYDVDHIVPQHLIKDDSLDNKVLTERVVNQRIKGGAYPIPEGIRCNPEVVRIWKTLHQHKQMSDKKFNNLIRASEITDEELNAFVNAQLNIVNVANIAIRDILHIKYPNAKLIFSKSVFASELRKKYGIAKVRDLNDTHHAVDAYLNVVAGVTLYQEYAKPYRRNEQQEGDKTFNMSKRMLDVLHYRHLEDRVISTCQRHDMLLTYRHIYNEDKFYNQTIYKKGESDVLIPVHTSGPLSNTDRYGGYQSLSSSYFVIADIQGKKNRRVIIDVKLMWHTLYSDEQIKEKLIERLQLKPGETATIDLSRPIQQNQKVEINGCVYLLRNSNEELVTLYPVRPIFLDDEKMRYLNFMQKHIDELKARIGETTFVLNQEEDHVVEVSVERNLQILRQLIQLSHEQRYSDNSIIARLDQSPAVVGFEQKDLADQCKSLVDCIRAFTRVLPSYQKGKYRKSKAVFMSMQPIAIHESITGLISKKKKL